MSAALKEVPARPAVSGEAPVFLHVFPNFGIGGVPLRIASIINQLGPRYRHIIVSLDGVTESRAHLSPELDVRIVCPPIDKRRPIATLLQIRRMLASTPHDLLLTHSWGSVEWALVNRLLRIAPHVHFESGFALDDPDGRLRRRVIARRFGFGGADRIAVPSHKLARLAADVWKLDRQRIVYIPNGVDFARFSQPPDPRAIPGLVTNPDEVVIGTVAPLRPVKNLGRLLRAFAAVPAPRARLVVVGDGPERQALAALAAQLGIAGRTLFAGHIAAPEKVYGLFDVFAMSSDTEQMPNTLLQAMAAGRAVAATDVGDICDIVTPDNRPYVVPCDETSLGQAIGRLARDAGLRAWLGAANQERARSTYALEAMCATYGALFEQCLARRATAG